ncbi:hypothetical protein HPB48_001399 [Haemaphysalis longicornis]|uniref:Uncharacterized protein n=1 Tax=Haemaphysalis longicornis TaxID=44386 RepID=A0A9J6GBM7_HAELO|nr:hypothetical protein HPB48_001399 [Haemaphysalis longicornis]
MHSITHCLEDKTASLTCDKTSDCGHREQLSVIIRYTSLASLCVQPLTAQLGSRPHFSLSGESCPAHWKSFCGLVGGAAAASSAPSEYAAQLRSRMKQAISLARRNLGKARTGQKAQYDKTHREVRYKAGDLVLRRNHVLSNATKGISASLSAKWSGPYRVGDALTPLVYQLVDPKGKPVDGPVNVADLKPFVARSDDWNDEEAAPSLRKQPKRGVAAQRPKHPSLPPAQARVTTSATPPR